MRISDWSSDVCSSDLADSAVDGRLRDLARYLAVVHGLDTLAPADAKQRLDAVSAGSPWAASVTELKALVALKAGDRDAARKLLTGLADDAVAPAGLRGRAAEKIGRAHV